MYSPEMQSKIIAWRQAAVAGTLTLAEMIEAVKALREGRMSAAAASAGAAKSKAKANVQVPSGDDLLNEMMG